jgi:hypothetical protein
MPGGILLYWLIKLSSPILASFYSFRVLAIATLPQTKKLRESELSEVICQARPIGGGSTCDGRMVGRTKICDV